MHTDINGCTSTAAGQEQYEYFESRKRFFIQYDYRTPDGDLFSTVTETLAQAHAKRDEWIEKQRSKNEHKNIGRIFRERKTRNSN